MCGAVPVAEKEGLCPVCNLVKMQNEETGTKKLGGKILFLGMLAKLSGVEGMIVKSRSRFQTARRVLIFWTLFIGLGAVAGAVGMLLAKKNSGVVMGGIFGVTLMLWICIQFYMFPPNFMSTIYFMFGFAQAATGCAAWVFALAAPVRSVQCRMGTYKTREL